MSKYLNLSTIIDVEPETCEVLSLLDDCDILEEFSDRCDYDFLNTLVMDYLCAKDIDSLRDILKSLEEEEHEEV